MKRLLLATVLGLGLIAPASAQINVVPQPGLATGYLPKITYSSAFFGLVPVVTSGTDEVCIAGSATKVVRVQRITINGTTTTAAQTLPILLLKRNTADTGGTAALTTANPGISTQIASRDTGQAPNTSSSAALISYTAAPTVNDSAPVYLETQLMNMPFPTTSTQAPGQADFNFQAWNEDLIATPTLRGTNQQICVNISAAITNASVWSGTIVWTEE